MLFIFSTAVLIRHLWQLESVVFLHRCLRHAVLFIALSLFVSPYTCCLFIYVSVYVFMCDYVYLCITNCQFAGLCFYGCLCVCFSLYPFDHLSISMQHMLFDIRLCVCLCVFSVCLLVCVFCFSVCPAICLFNLFIFPSLYSSSTFLSL